MTRIPLSVVDEKAKELTERLEMSTAEIGLSVRTTNCLEERGIFTVHDLLQCTGRRLAEHLEFRREDARRSVQGLGEHRIFPPRIDHKPCTPRVVTPGP